MIFSMLEGGIQSLIVLQMSIAMDIEEDWQPNVATSAESLDAEDRQVESMNRCEPLLLNLELRTMLSIQAPSEAHQELSIQVFVPIEPLA